MNDVIIYIYDLYMSKSKDINVLKSLIMFLSQSTAREKVFRLITYFGKFLVTRYQQQYETMIYNRDGIKMKTDKLNSLIGASGMGRKILRFGPSITTVKTILTNIQNIAEGKINQPLVIVILKTLSAFFIAMFFICDHYAWLFKMGLAKDQNIRKFMEYWSAMGFFLDCVTNTIKNAILTSQDKNVLENKPLLLDFSRVLADLVVSYSFIKPGSVNGKTVGLLGSYTSLVGIYNLWK